MRAVRLVLGNRLVELVLGWEAVMLEAEPEQTEAVVSWATLGSVTVLVETMCWGSWEMARNR